MQHSFWIGFDSREAAAFAVARSSLRRRMIIPVPIYGIILDQLRADGLYYRPTEYRAYRGRGTQLWDVLSDAPMSTQFAISRFFVPVLAREMGLTGWAAFMDCDMLALERATSLFQLADNKYAVMCVKHKHEPPPGLKMDGQEQTRYARKNWSSMILWNLDHPANLKVTVDLLNKVPGRDLHRFCWLDDDEIGELPAIWNYLVGHTVLPELVRPILVHFTDGTPDMPGYEEVEYAHEWRKELEQWVSKG